MAIFLGLLSSLSYGIFGIHFSNINMSPAGKTLIRNGLVAAVFFVFFCIFPQQLDVWFVVHTIGIGFLAFLSFWLFALSLGYERLDISKPVYFLQYSIIWMLGVMTESATVSYYITSLIILSIPILQAVILTTGSAKNSSAIPAFFTSLSGAIAGGIAIFWVISIVPVYGVIAPNLASTLGASIWTGGFLLIKAWLGLDDTIVWREKLALVASVDVFITLIASILGGFFITQSINFGLPGSMLALILSTSGFTGIYYGKLLDYGNTAIIHRMTYFASTITYLCIIGLMFFS